MWQASLSRAQCGHQAPRPSVLRGSSIVATRQRPASARVCQASASFPPAFIPAEQLAEITEPAALDMASRMRHFPTTVPCYPSPVQTAVVPPSPPTSASTSPSSSAAAANGPPVVLLHGFDSSCLEFRRLLPQLQGQLPVWAVDLVGWGFTDCGFGGGGPQSLGLTVGPKEKRQHLYAFWKQHIKSPMVLVGASLGGTIAMDFAIEHPDAVERLVLIDPQATADGVNPLPRPLAWLGVQVLKAVPLRQVANKMAYFDVEQYATNDAMLVGRLHTHLPGWVDANVAFIQSGGYRISKRLGQVPVPSLVLWGRNDKILPPEAAEVVVQQLPDAVLVWAEDCGHCPHLEQPEFTARAILEFVGAGVPANA